MYYFSAYSSKIITAIYCLCFAGSIACISAAYGDNPPSAIHGGLVTSTHQYNSLEYTLTVGDVFQQGEVVPINFNLKNIGSTPLQEIQTAIDPSISVYKYGLLVWSTAPPGGAVPEYAIQFGLDRGESKDFGFAWDQKNNKGNVVGAGIYTIKASFSKKSVWATINIQKTHKGQ